MPDDQPTTGPPTTAQPRPKRSNWASAVLLAIVALSFGLYVFVRLDRSVAEWLGPVGEGVHDLFNRVPGQPLPLTPAARRLVKDVTALGGDPSVHVSKRGVFGTIIGQTDWANVTFRDLDFDDAALAQLAEAHGGQIGGLYLENTGVTDAGLKSLSKFTILRHLSIHNFRRRMSDPVTPPKITDAGLVHLRSLDHLWSLMLNDLPITDSGLEAINDLPELIDLVLSSTKVQGRSLAGMKSLPWLSTLYLNDSEMTEDGLKGLSGATSLQMLSLEGVPLSANALPLLKAIPGLKKLELKGCGFLDEEIADLVKSRPGLRIER